MKKFILLSLCFIFISCASTKLDILEKSFEPQDLTDITDLEYLKEGEKPIIINTSNMEDSFYEFCSKENIPIGYCSFYGPKFKDFDYLINYAKTIKAKYILFSEKYNRTLTYQNGSVNQFGGVLSTDNYDIFDYSVCFLIKDNRNKKYGFLYENLTEAQRTQLQQNTGVYITLIYQNTPAFYNNLIRGDIVIKLNETKIINVEQFEKELKAVSDDFTFTVLRNGVEKVIKFEYLTKN